MEKEESQSSLTETFKKSNFSILVNSQWFFFYINYGEKVWVSPKIPVMQKLFLLKVRFNYASHCIILDVTGVTALCFGFYWKGKNIWNVRSPKLRYLSPVSLPIYRFMNSKKRKKLYLFREFVFDKVFEAFCSS